MTVQPRPDLGAPVAWSFPDIDTTVVGPGLSVHALHTPGRGLAAIDLRLDAPITAEPGGFEGLARLTAQALDEGSSRRDGDAFAAALDTIGADLHAGAGTGGMVVSVDVPVDRLPDALGLLAEAAGDPVFPAREVDRLRQQRLDNIRQQLARPDERIGIVQREVMIDGHRCALPGGGTLDTVADIDRDTCATFHADHALTGPATLVVACDLSGLDLPALAGAQFGPWAGAARDLHAPDPVAVRAAPRMVVVDKPGAVQTQLLVARAGPDRHADDWPATRVAAYVLGGTLTSRLDMVLREDKGYTYGIRSRLATYRRGGIAQLASGSVDTPNTTDAVRLALQIIATLAANGPRPDEVEAAVAYLAGVRPLALETPRALASEITRNLGDDLVGDHTEDELAALRAVTVEQVAAAAATHLGADDTTVIAIGAAAEIVDGLAGLDHADVEVRE